MCASGCFALWFGALVSVNIALMHKPLPIPQRTHSDRILRLRGGDEYAWMDEKQESESNFSSHGSDEENWDYGKFGMRPPPTAAELGLNPQYSGTQDELNYLATDTFIGRWGWTALHRAAIEGDVATLRNMIEMGGDVNSATQSGWTPLHEAAKWGRTDTVEFLISSGANASATTKGGWNALHFAASVAHIPTIEKLLWFGVDPNFTDIYGDKPLDKALRNGRARYPLLPARQKYEMSGDERRQMYMDAAALLAPNGTDLEQLVLSEDRFNVHPPLMPGRRRPYAVDGMEDESSIGSSGEEEDDDFNPNTQWLKEVKEDFVNEDQARDLCANSMNATEVAKLEDFINSQESRLPPTLSNDGVQDEEIQSRLDRWKDEEWEQRIENTVIE